MHTQFLYDFTLCTQVILKSYFANLQLRASCKEGHARLQEICSRIVGGWESNCNRQNVLINICLPPPKFYQG